MKYLNLFEEKSSKSEVEVRSTVLVSAFPGCGKSYLFENKGGLKVIDSDSSTFDKSDFPSNYIKHIKENIGKQDVICISSHKEVRDALTEAGLFFIFAYPNIDLKDEYLNRYEKRGSDESFIKLLDENWFNWLKDSSKQKGCVHLQLEKDEYLSDKVKL